MRSETNRSAIQQLSRADNMMRIAEAAATGDRLTTLETLRDRLAADLDNTSDPRAVAALALRLTDVLQQIEAMPTTKQVSAADEIADRRAARRGGSAPHPARPTGAV